MSSGKKGAYGTDAKSSDTGFRKTWDREEYAARAAERDAQYREEGKARHEAALQGKKYHRRASTPPDAKDSEARERRLDVSAQIGTQSLVPAGASMGKRGQGAGFYCSFCDLTFKDNLQLVEHENSRQHLQATGQTGNVRRAGLQEVRDRLAWLHRRAEERRLEPTDLGSRIEALQAKDERERAEKRRLRNERRRKTPGGVGVQT